MITTRRAARFLVSVLGAVVLLTGCGGDTAPADEVPLLADRLALVDRAVSSGNETQIREQVETLIDATERARDAGQLDDEQAERVLAAADSLLARLPDEATPQPSPSPPTSSPAPPSTPEEGDDEESDEDDEDEGHEEAHEEHPEKDKPKPDKPEKGKGKGH